MGVGILDISPLTLPTRAKSTRRKVEHENWGNYLELRTIPDDVGKFRFLISCRIEESIDITYISTKLIGRKGYTLFFPITGVWVSSLTPARIKRKPNFRNNRIVFRLYIYIYIKATQFIWCLYIIYSRNCVVADSNRHEKYEKHEKQVRHQKGHGRMVARRP